MLSYQIIVICGHKIDNITAFKPLTSKGELEFVS